MSTRSEKPAAATRCRASRCCSADSVTERTCAPRAAARRHSSPQPVPISSTRLSGRTRAASSRRSILRRCASASWPGSRAVCRTAHWNRSWSRRGTRRTVRWTGRSARRCCGAPDPGCWLRPRRRATAIGRSRCSAGGTRSATDVANSVSTPTRSSDAPFARHVGLAEPDQAVPADPRANAGIGDHHCRQVGSAAPITEPSGYTRRTGRRAAARRAAGRRRRCGHADRTGRNSCHIRPALERMGDWLTR